MKKNILFVLIAFLCLGCEDKADENTITIDSYNLEFPPEGGTLSFNITCATDWDILRMYSNDGIELSTQHGTGNQTVNVTLRPNEYSVAKQRLLAIRAANGVTKQLFVSQYAKNGGNKLFQMTRNHQYVSGDAGVEASVYLLCSTPRCFWSLNGDAPWLEVSKDDGQTWTSAAGQIISQYHEGVNLKFRTVARNEDTHDREAKFVIYYGGQEPAEMSITQLGSIRTSSDYSGILANSLCVSWIFGCDVSYFHTMLTTEDIELSSLTKTQVKKWEKYSPEEGLRLLWSNLNENTKYYLYVASFDKQGNLAKSRRAYTTRSSKYQPEIAINSYGKTNGYWKWLTTPNSYTDHYYQWVIDDATIFNYADATLAWYLTKHEDDAEVFSGLVEHSKEGSGPYMIVTWGFDADGNPSGVIKRQIIGNK